MKKFAILLSVILSTQLNAQDYLAGFGKPNLNEITLTEFSKDKNAEAAVLYDIGKSGFTRTDNGFEVYFERSTKIKIFKKSGFHWAEVEIPFYYEGNIAEKVFDIEAFAYNIENGVVKKTQLNEKNIFEDKKNEYWRQMKFAIPDVKEGTVIEYKYSIRSPYLFNLRDWEFQSSIPIVYSEYTTRMTPFYEYIYILQGRSSLDVFESHEDTGLDNQFGTIIYKDMVYKFGLKDVPALTDESFITSRNDYIIKLDFQLAKIHYPNGSKKDIISTWPALNNELLKTTEFGRYINASEKAAKESFNFSEIAGKNKLEQLEYIVNQVKSQYSWNNTNSKYAGKSVKEFLKEKTGNSAEINLFLLGVLRAAGIEANAVIISTRSNGKISSDYPFMHFYNYVIVMVNVDGKHLLADATEPMCPFNKIPPRCVNEIGLIVKKDGQDFVKLSNSDKSFLDKSITIQYTAGLDSLKASINATYSNYESFDFKKEYQDDIEKIKSSIVKKGYLTVDSLKTENYSDSKKNYKVSYSTSLALEYLENKTYISPFLNEAITENPLKQLTRQYPLDFIYPYGRTFKSIITVPKGYKVQFMPAGLNINNNQVTISYQITEIEENKLIVTGAYIFNNGLYTAEEYPKIRYYFNEIIKKFNEKIVLEKIAL